VGELTSTSSQAYQYFAAGELAREEQRYAIAVRYFEQALEYDSTFALALFRLSETYYQSGERGGLDRDYANKAWELRAHLGIKDSMALDAWRQRLNRNVQDALAAYRKMLNEWPDDRAVIRDLISLLYYYWFFAEAAEVAREGLELYPDDQIIASFGWPSMANTGHIEEAIASIQAYLERHTRSVRGWEELGWRYLELGQTDSAEEAFQQVLEIDPSFLFAQRGIGSCHYQRGDLDRALETCEQILERSDLLPAERVGIISDIRNWVCLSGIHASAGRFEKALELINEARKLITDPQRDARLERDRGWLLLRMGRADEVLLAAQTLAKRKEEVIYASNVALEIGGRAFVMLDSLEAAERMARELAVEGQIIQRYVFVSHKIRAEIALASGDHERAFVYLKEMQKLIEMIGLGLTSIEYWEDLARSYEMAGQLDEAVNALKELLRLRGGYALAHYELGKIYELMNRPDDAKDEYERFLEMWSNADEGLPQLEDARERLAKLQGV
jgi:tetratricopeptide (TPR) repeat protein